MNAIWPRALLLLLCAALPACNAETGTPGNAVTGVAKEGSPPPQSVLKALERGVNISNWFTHRGERNQADPDEDPLISDFELIRELGFRHVRIQLDLELLLDDSAPDGFDQEGINRLEKALADLRVQRLVTVLALQPSSAYKAALSEGGGLEAFNDFWYRLASRLKKFPADFLLFEVLNEPEYQDAAKWGRDQARLAGAIRAAAPDHTVVLAGHKYSDVEQLVALTPIQDRNTIYSFHFYDPHNFTHQGATWGYEMWSQFRGFPYPVDTVAGDIARRGIPEAAVPHLDHYLSQGWDRSKLETVIERAATWARENGAILYCSEFGAYRPAAPLSARANWLRDVRELLEERDIGWAVWDYAGGFGVATGKPGEREVDRYAASALGLNVDR